MRRSILPLALVLATTAACASDRGARPPVPPGVDPAHLHFTEPSMRVGDPAPDFELPYHDGGGTVRLSSLQGKPVVLILGSYT